MTNSIEITPVESATSPLIQGYGKGGFRIGIDGHQQGSVILITEQKFHWYPPATDNLSIIDLEPVIERASEIDILVFGCGASFTTPPSSLRNDLKEHNIVLEWMDTGAACRTFNLLITEARRVAAALIATD